MWNCTAQAYNKHNLIIFCVDIIIVIMLGVYGHEHKHT